MILVDFVRHAHVSNPKIVRSFSVIFHFFSIHKGTKLIDLEQV